jgi:hypothetical protein
MSRHGQSITFRPRTLLWLSGLAVVVGAFGNGGELFTDGKNPVPTGGVR